MDNKLIKHSIPYTLEHLVSWIHNCGGVDFNPPYQRDFRWNDNKKRNFIDHLVKNKGLNQPFIWTTTNKYPFKFEIFDGKQRTQCILDYLQGRHPFKTAESHEERFKKIKDVAVKLDINEYENEQDKIDHFIAVNNSSVKMDIIDILFSERTNYPSLLELSEANEKWIVAGFKNTLNKKRFITNIVAFSIAEPKDQLKKIYSKLKDLDILEVKNRINLGLYFYNILENTTNNNKIKIKVLKQNSGAMFIARLVSRNLNKAWISVNFQTVYDCFDKFIEKAAAGFAGYQTQNLHQVAEECLLAIPFLEKRKVVPEKTKNELLNVENSEFFHVDHIVPVSLGGTNDFNNLQILPIEENLKKGAKIEY